MSFLEKLHGAIEAHHSLLCVGLDPDPDRLPVANVVDFNRAIIDATADLVCAYKPNFAFYEQLGAAGWPALEATVRAVPANVPVIGDAKRGDIGHTATAYARAVFDHLGCDAVTVNPYLGRDAIEPFLRYEDRGVYLLCRTSNPGGRDLQDLRVIDESGTEPLYVKVAESARQWNKQGNLGLVVGATYPAELTHIRSLAPELPLLVPGVGAQGGDLAAVLETVRHGSGPVVITVSRPILYGSAGPDFATAAREAAHGLREEIERGLPAGFFSAVESGC